MRLAFVLSFLAASAWAAPAKVVELPEDLGPAAIDVSSYPPEHQATYRDVFVPLYGYIRGGPARALNSPVIELDAAQEAALRRDAPELFSGPDLAQVGPDLWRKEVTRIKNRPRCCGACPVLSKADAVRLWKFFAYDSIRRKTGPNAKAWLQARRELIKKFKESKP